ncbi:QRFP-like peptide receptor [Tribolium castaneum]|uniref:QRFP-like peptide receptor n=1 Tax=Tribolium castaneum TaxID=7070 RepID=UPI0030FE4370
MCDDIIDNVTDINNTIFDWNELIPAVVVYSVTFVLGLVGNCLIIFTTFQYRGMQSVTNVFLSSLASADLLLIIICIPVKLAKLFSYIWIMGFFICKMIHYLQNISAICSVMTLTAISIERYYAIVYPMKAKYICTINQAKRIIGVIWIMSFVLAVPTLFAQSHMRVSNNNDPTEYYICVKDWDSTEVWRFHEIYMLVVILIVPFVIMTFSYTTICWEVWKVMERRSVMTSKHVLSRNRSSTTNSEDKYLENFILTENKHPPPPPDPGHDDSNMVKQVIYMLVAVVVLFAICWTPLLIDNLLTAYEIHPNIRCGFLKYMSIAFHLLAYFNSCINPIIYGFMSKSFRESFKLVLCSCCSSDLRGHRGSNYSLRYVSRTGSQTRTTSYR